MTKPIVFRHWQQHTEASTHSLVSLVVHWVGPVTVDLVFVCWIWIEGLDPSRAARRRRARPLLSYRRVPEPAWQLCRSMIRSAWREAGFGRARRTLVVFGVRGTSLDYVGSGFLSNFLVWPSCTRYSYGRSASW